MPHRFLVLLTLGVAFSLGQSAAQDFEDLLRRSESGQSPRSAEPPVATVIEAAPGGEQVIRGRNTVTTATPIPPASQPASVVEPSSYQLPEEQTASPEESPNRITGSFSFASPSQVWRIDPTSPILQSTQTDGTPFEPTSLFVNRTLVAVEVDPEFPQTPQWTSSIPLNIPVIYRSRSLVWSQEDFAQARKIVKEIEQLLAQSKELPAKFEALSKQWNELVEKGTPSAVLMADSPSLPSNQGDSEILRGEPLPGFDAGSGIRFEIKEAQPSSN